MKTVKIVNNVEYVDKTTVHYEFSAFPARYDPRYRDKPIPQGFYGYKGYFFFSWSVFKYDTLRDARQEAKRLKNIYAMCRPSILNDYPDILKISMVERTELDNP